MIHCLNLNMKNVMRVKINILLSLQYLDTFFLSGIYVFINNTRLPSRFARHKISSELAEPIGIAMRTRQQQKKIFFKIQFFLNFTGNAGHFICF